MFWRRTPLVVSCFEQTEAHKRRTVALGWARPVLNCQGSQPENSEISRRLLAGKKTRHDLRRWVAMCSCESRPSLYLVHSIIERPERLGPAWYGSRSLSQINVAMQCRNENSKPVRCSPSVVAMAFSLRDHEPNESTNSALTQDENCSLSNSKYVNEYPVILRSMWV